MFHSSCGQSQKTVSINHNFLKERRAEADRTEVLLLTSLALTARPHRLTFVVLHVNYYERNSL